MTALSNLDASIFLLISIVLFASLILARKRPLIFIGYLFALLGRLFGVLLKPIVVVLRALRLISRQTEATGSSVYGPGVLVGLAHFFSAETETDREIANNFDTGSVDIACNRGLVCVWLRPEEIQPDAQKEYDKERASANMSKATHFFNFDVPIDSQPQFLYDDVNAALIVRLFENSDKPCFHVMSEMKKTITGNVMKLSVFFSVIVSLVLILNPLWGDIIPFSKLLNEGGADPIVFSYEIAGWQFSHSFSHSWINRAGFGFVSCLIGIGFMWLFYQMEYKHFQRNNGRELNNYLTRYLARIGNNFRSIERNSVQAIVDEKDVSQMKEESVLWVMNMQWTAFRVFFIEYFLRNIRFQIVRNSSYFLIFVPLGFLIVIFSVASFLEIHQISLFNSDSDLYKQNTFYVFFFLLLLVYYNYLKHSLKFFDETVREKEWIQFHDLNIQNATSKLIEAYTTQLNMWRTRFQAPGANV